MSRHYISFLILSMMTLGQIGTDIYLPSFPSMAHSLHTSIGGIEMSFSVFMASFGLSQLVYGPLIDRYGRKPFLMMGIMLYSLMSLFASQSSSLTALLIARTIQGFGAGACSVIPRAIMRDIFSEKMIRKLSIYQSLVWSLIPILAPFVGSYIQHYLGWRYNFIVLCFISIGALGVSVFYQETLSNSSHSIAIKYILKAYWKILSDSHFFTALCCSVGTVSLLTAFNVSSPMILQQYLGMSSLQYGWSLLAISSAFMLGTILNRILMPSLSGRRILIIGLLLIFFSALSFLLCVSLSVHRADRLLAPIFLLQLGAALFFPGNAAKAMSVFPEKAGSTAAIFGSSLFVGGAIISALIASLSHQSLLPLASLFLLISLMMMFFHRFAINN